MFKSMQQFAPAPRTDLYSHVVPLNNHVTVHI